MLTPDELGEKGESRFKELCADAKIICNKSDRDRAGWDFILDFNFEDNNAHSLDKREAPTSCYVQVKTIWENSKNIKLKLNMADRLAKEVKPAFIFVAKVNKKLDIVDIFLIHILDNRLEAILKRLRKESASKTRTPLNKQFITFTPRQEERIGLSGADLRNALEKQCGDTTFKYTNQKQDQLKKLGYPDKPIGLKIQFSETETESISDLFLGIKSNVPAALIESYETRFGITIQNTEPAHGMVSIEPTPTDTCRVLIKGTLDTKPAIFNADLYIAPQKITGWNNRLLLKNNLFSFDIIFSETGIDHKIKISTTPSHATINEWKNYWKTLHIVHKTGGTIEVTPHGKKTIFLGNIISDAKNKISYEKESKLCETALNCLSHAGFDESQAVDWEEIIKISSLLIFLEKIIDGKIKSIACEITDKNLIKNVSTKEKTIMVGSTVFLDKILSFYAIAYLDIKKGISQIEVSNPELRNISLLDDKDALVSFIENAKTSENIDTVLQFN